MDLTNNNACVISLGFGGHYSVGVKRLERSLNFTGWAGDVITWKDDLPPGCPPVNEYPYAFKVYCFEEAFRRGYKIALWADASIYAIKPIMPIFDYINDHGLYFFKSGYSLAETTTDALLNYAGLMRDDLVDVSEFATGLIGINIDNPNGQMFFEQWRQYMLDGMFKGGRFYEPADSAHPLFKFSRQDQSAASVVLHKMGIKTAGEDKDFVAYYGTDYNLHELIFWIQGIG